MDKKERKAGYAKRYAEYSAARVELEREITTASCRIHKITVEHHEMVERFKKDYMDAVQEKDLIESKIDAQLARDFPDVYGVFDWKKWNPVDSMVKEGKDE